MPTKTQAVTSDAFALPAPCDADQAEQAGDEQPDRNGNRNGDVGACPGSERKYHVGDEDARSHTRQGEREGHLLICERFMRTVSSDGGMGVGIGSRTNDQSRWLAAASTQFRSYDLS